MNAIAPFFLQPLTPPSRIRNVSRWAWIFCVALFALNLVCRWQTLLLQFESDTLDRINFFHQFEDLVWSLCWSGFFIRLFRLFEKGQIFTTESASCLRVLGGVCIVKFLADGIWNSIVISTHNTAPGWMPTWWWVNQLIYSPNTIFTGVATLLAAYLLDQARVLKEEQDLTI